MAPRVGAHRSDSGSSGRFPRIPSTCIISSAICLRPPLLTQESTRRPQSHLAELINERKISNDKDEKGDLLSNLVNANEELSGDGEQRLREEELIGANFALR